MAYYNEFFIERQGKLTHIGSCTGSDTPYLFKFVESIDTFEQQLNEVKRENGFVPHRKGNHPFPWKTYKTSDHLIVLRKINQKWFHFWEPSHEIWISQDKYSYGVDNPNQCNFVEIEKCTVVGTGKFTKDDLITLDLPKLKRN